MVGRSFSLGTPVSFSNTTYHHDITELLLRVALNTITLTTSTTPFRIVYHYKGNVLKFEINTAFDLAH
jgi:hypothetical protein